MTTETETAKLCPCGATGPNNSNFPHLPSADTILDSLARYFDPENGVSRRAKAAVEACDGTSNKYAEFGQRYSASSRAVARASVGTSGKRAAFARGYGATEMTEQISKLACPKCGDEGHVQLEESATYYYAAPTVLAGKLVLGDRRQPTAGEGDFTCCCRHCQHTWLLPGWVEVL